ncbi:MAG: hypothetical protein ACFCVD_19485 [Nodosilinea sp.]
MNNMPPACPRRIYTLTMLLTLASGINLVAASIAAAQAQDIVIPPQVGTDGSVRVDSNAFDRFTGDLNNGSNIPLPDGLITNPIEGVAQPTRPGLAPNTVETTIDVDDINRQFDQELLNRPETSGRDFNVVEESLEFTTQFNLNYFPTNHFFGEGIQVTVFDENGAVKSTETAFVRGDVVVTDANGETLPSTAQINVAYDADDIVELRVLNIRQNGAAATDSGIYFSTEGEFAVEDFLNGGDRDFNDGEYFSESTGEGTAQIESDTPRITETISFRTETVETPLEPLLRQEQFTEENRLQTEEVLTEVDEERRSGQIQVANPGGTTLPHAYGARTANDDHLVYDQYVGTAQVRAGSDGGSVTGQFSPLAGNPAAPPTLVTGTLRYNPFAANNQAGIDFNASLTQFITPTHEEATDMFGVVVVNPDPEGPRLIQPTGIATNTRMGGYVAPIPEQVVPGQQFASVGGVFDLPDDQDIIISPPNAASVGPGNAAYTQNVGGIIIEKADGTAEFVPQWNYQGFRTEPITLEAGTAERVIYALVPQQGTQNLQLGQTYALIPNPGPNGGFLIADGEYQVISADQHPENFNQEQPDVYGVEDTLAQGNYATDLFNGVQGFHRLVPGGDLIPTVDLVNPENVDARVGNQLSAPDVVIPGVAGQSAYLTTSRAAAFYVRGDLSMGIGNQEDTVITTTSTFLSQTDAIYQQTFTNFFATPRTQVDTTSTQITTRETETGSQTGSASFDIDSNGLLDVTDVQLNPPEVIDTTVETLEGPTTVESTVVVGAEALVDSTVDSQITELISSEVTLVDQQVATSTDSYPNVSPLLGEFSIGGVLNFGNTPWTPAANTLRLEAFIRGSVVGQGTDGGNVGWRAEAVFNPFGEEQRPAYMFDEVGTLTPIYQTTPLFDADGNPASALVADASGQSVQVATHEFVLDEQGQRVLQTVGTGRAVGPGIYLRIEDLFTNDVGPALIGGLKFDL